MSSSDEARSLNARGIALLESGVQTERALATFRAAVERYPLVAELHNNLGVALQQTGHASEAIAELQRAIELQPNFPEAHASLGNAFVAQSNIGAAVEAYRAALALRPDFVDVHLRLYEALQMLGDRGAAVDHLTHALRKQRVFTESASERELRSVLVLMAVGDWKANVPLDFVIDKRFTTVHKVFVGEGLPEASDLSLPPYDVVFNAVAQSTATESALRAVERFARAHGVRVLNDPAAVAASNRTAVEEKLRSIPRCRVARILSLTRRECAPERFEQALRDHGLALPVLIRPIDSQAGEDLLKLERIDQLGPYLEATGAPEYYAIEFIDYRSADGFYRKYRVMFVDGEAYPCHLAISGNWMVHYYNSLMAEYPWMRDEERAFLQDLGSVFDAPLRGVLGAIAERMGLDYCGIDCTLIPNGDLFVFEADPAMIVHLSDPIEIYPYKHEYIPRISRALEAMIDRRRA